MSWAEAAVRKVCQGREGKNMRNVAQEFDLAVQRKKTEFERWKVRRYDPILVMEKNVHIERPEEEHVKDRRSECGQ